ncbi:hypothetical protein FHW96_002763 [Novosphingobium sp. SG751A]|uniref:hypothetical protein n=1 Tax=Novosphingobium sp. SG751A TaxID=2587000 RepID=UPI0015549993|nr:hypothetical protein [Novosphingobium sp. SG751A]NOW46603.1 hypothetical protein [Novosphingobium sp. SG751A]
MNCLNLAAIGLHLLSIHEKPGYNDQNYGLYAQSECGFVVGGYYNSYRRPSFQIGWRAETDHLPLFFEIGGVTGYPNHLIEPYAMAGVKLGPLRVGFVPHVTGVNKTSVVHAMVQFKL